MENTGQGGGMGRNWCPGNRVRYNSTLRSKTRNAFDEVLQVWRY